MGLQNLHVLEEMVDNMVFRWPKSLMFVDLFFYMYLWDL